MTTKPELTHNDLMEAHPKGAPLFFRVLRALRKALHWALPRRMPRRVVRGGLKFVFAEHHPVLYRGYLERDQIVYFFNMARCGGADIFLDIGTNFGFYALTATKTGDFAEIHALEPQPETYRQLVANIQANSLTDIIRPHNVAASDKTGEMFIDCKPHGMANVSSEKWADTLAVKAATLDSLFAFRGRRIAAKIDVEGYEVAVLDGMRDLLAHNAVLLQVEIWGHKPESMYYFISGELRCIHRFGDDFYFINDKWEKNDMELQK